MADEQPISFDDVVNYFRIGGKELRARYPKIYGALGGFLGTAPDEFEGSLLDPLTAEVRKGAEIGFPIGTAAAVTPIMGGVAASKGLTTGSKAAQAGMLRLGGREDLIASHGTYLNALIDPVTKNLIPQLNNLSLAINRDKLVNPFGNALLIPRAGKFDPRTSPSVLHVENAYTPRAGQSLEVQAVQSGVTDPRELARLRLRDKFGSRWPEGGKNAIDVTDEGESLVNPRFDSFAAYEKSPYADNLQSSVSNLASRVQDPKLMQILMDEKLSSDRTIADVFNRIMETPGRTYRGVDKYEIYKALKQSPRAFAEIKNYGPTGLTPDTFAGVMANPPSSRTYTAKGLRDAKLAYDQLMSSNIPIVPLTRSPVRNFQIAAELQRKAK